MRDVSGLQGPRDLERIKTYATDHLTPEEKSFIQKMTKKLEAYIREKSNSFFTFEEIVKLGCLWQKYEHLRPFRFRFNPKEKIPAVYENRTAFIIWTVWRAYHLRGEEDLETASLEAAKILSTSSPPYPQSIKEEVVRKFAEIMENTGYPCPNDLSFSFWEKKIFPYLEGVWEFKWEMG